MQASSLFHHLPRHPRHQAKAMPERNIKQDSSPPTFHFSFPPPSPNTPLQFPLYDHPLKSTPPSSSSSSPPRNKEALISRDRREKHAMMELLSQMWSLLGLLTVLQNVLPTQLLSLLHSLWQSLQDALTPYSYFDVPEFLGSSAVDPNPLYRHVHLYLHHHLLLHPPSPPPRLTLSPQSHSLSPNHSISDPSFPALWTHHSDTLNDSLEERRSFSLRLPKRHLLQPYLSHLSSTADQLHRASRDRRLFTNPSSSSSWASVPFRHPSTFQTLALDPSLRSHLLSDLSSFASARDFYRRTGRAWKRGYLLHGPPGSGKSSLIAAMANHLSYDVYDLELTRVADNSDLRSLLIQTTNRSIIVIEDIDCSLDLTGDRGVAAGRKKRMPSTASDEDDGGRRRRRVTLSGLLNFTDGLWSCCGEERGMGSRRSHGLQ